MKVTIRREQSGMYHAMCDWLIRHHSQCPEELISHVYKTFAVTPNLDVKTLDRNSFVFPEPVNGEYIPLRKEEIEVIDDVIKRESERYQIN
ncbi:hypothetical protein HQ489_02995 [Candidatus Woesearchaeota archaeon]|nr:hypothetical protein [Candidatus Woesearchaeota archaeon]